MNTLTTNSDGIQLRQAEITLSPDIITLLGKKLYQNPTSVILTRELLQNARDATIESGKIQITTEYTGDYNITVDDTGIGMSEDTLTNVFLTIGGTLKTHKDSVGGFGIAKVSLFASDTWEVHTRNTVIDNTLFLHTTRNRKGTRVTATIKEAYYWNKRDAELMVLSSNVKRLTLNGSRVKPYVGKKLISTIYDYNSPIAKVYIASKLDGTSDKIFYRIRGLTQYFEDLYDNYGVNFVVDFDSIDYKPRDDKYPFSMSREQVKDSIRREILSVLKPYLKNKLTTQSELNGGGKKERIKIHSDYITINQPSDLSVEDRKYHRHVFRLWHTLITSMLGKDTLTGMIYSPSARAQRRQEGNEVYYLVNPAYFQEITTDNITPPFESYEALLWSMVHLAIHEVTHDVVSDHDESFTSQEFVTTYKYIQHILDNMSNIRIYAKQAYDALSHYA